MFRGRHQPPPLLLPSLDTAGQLIEPQPDRFLVLRLGPSPLRVPREGGTAFARANLRPVKEQSQIDDMRAAIQGDRERAEQARQRSTENVRVLIEPAVAEPAPAPEPEPAPAQSRFSRFFGR